MHIGSAGSNFNKWNKISKNSILISVDGNKSSIQTKKKFLKVIDENVIISNKSGRAKFFVTKDPDCSSLLEPNEKVYKNWYLAHRFKIQKKINVNVIEINNFLKSKKIKYIDWLVIDIQGIDLKVIKKLKYDIKKEISILDIEPGFDFFYKKADTISEVFDYMQKFYIFSDMTFGYNFMVKNKNLKFLEKKLLFHTNKPSKIYSNINFVNKINNKRTLLLKLIYLLGENKIFEARDLINDNINKDKFLFELRQSVNNLLIFYKLKFILLLPFYFIKKFFKN